jgi:hypothetical protein
MKTSVLSVCFQAELDIQPNGAICRACVFGITRVRKLAHPLSPFFCLRAAGKKKKVSSDIKAFVCNFAHPLWRVHKAAQRCASFDLPRDQTGFLIYLT